MDSRWLGPGCGVGAVLLIFGSFLAAGSQPGPDAPIDEVTAFYTEHDAGQLAAASLMSLGALLFLIFASIIVRRLRAVEAEGSAWTTVCFGGGVLVATGLLLFAGLAVALGDVAGDLEPSALQALHVLYQELLFPLTIGVSAFMLGAGIATLRTGALPSWAGWLAVVVGVVAAVPSHVLGSALDHIGFGGFLGLALWTLIVSGLLARRERPSPPPRLRPPQP
jgi:hypothetical protein